MTEPRTQAERYLEGRLADPDYAIAYRQATRRMEIFDNLMRALDARREELAITKAALARRAGMTPEAVRRLFSSKEINPTLSTLAALADALELDLMPAPRRANIDDRQQGDANGELFDDSGTP